MITSQTIPNHLRRFRREAGFTQHQVAWILRLSGRGQLWLWERGLSFPNITNLFKLSILYHRLPPDLYLELYWTLKDDIQERLSEMRELAPGSPLDRGSNDAASMRNSLSTS